MQDYLKKPGLFLGHMICIFVLIFCFADAKGWLQEEENIVQAADDFQKEGSITPTGVPLQEQTPLPAVPENVSPAEPTITTAATPENLPSESPTESPVPTEAYVVDEREEVKKQVLQNIAEGKYSTLENDSDEWWFRRKENHVPSGSGENFSISDYQGFYRNRTVSEDDKVLYLTIDCGYGSSNTSVILDVFQRHEIKATFFVTEYFMEETPEVVIRMVEEGHTVANHSVTHANLTELSEQEIYEEIIGCEETFYELTGTQMSLYFRPPQGAYSKRTMQITEDLGYKTIFWSLAYRDFDKNNQPGKEYVLEHFATYHHNGAIPLMHNDSDSNKEAMDELITYLKEQGYRFGTLDELK